MDLSKIAKGIACLALISSVILPADAHAAYVEVKASADYVLGDNDSKADAKKIALEYAKRNAVEKVATFIQASTTSKDGILVKNEISTYSASILQTKILSEIFKVQKDSSILYRVDISAKVDKDTLFRRINEAKKDKDKQRAIEELQKQNKKLLTKLTLLNNELKLKDRKTSRITLIEERDLIFTQIEENNNQIDKIFARGSLLTLARKRGNDFLEAKKDIRRNIREYIKRNTNIKVGDPDIRNRGDGSVDVLVKIIWDMDKRKILDVLNKYFDASGHDEKIWIKEDNNEESKQKRPFTHDLYRYLLTKQILIRVSAGGYSQTITIGKELRGAFDNDYRLHTTNASSPRNLFYREENPVRIKNIPLKKLENVSKINVRIEIVTHS